MECVMLIEKYKKCVARNASQRLSIPIHDVQEIMRNSGIDDIIDGNPLMSIHFAPEDWVENIEAHLRTLTGNDEIRER